MILDTTYLLPLARIDVEPNLLKAIAEKRVPIRFDEIGVSLVSLFELQAKSVRESIPVRDVIAGVNAVFDAFRVEPFYTERVITISFELMGTLRDYVDSIVVATAAAQKENLVTEDSLIHDSKNLIRQRYGIEVKRFSDLVHAS